MKDRRFLITMVIAAALVLVGLILLGEKGKRHEGRLVTPSPSLPVLTEQECAYLLQIYLQSAADAAMAVDTPEFEELDLQTKRIGNAIAKSNCK